MAVHIHTNIAALRAHTAYSKVERDRTQRQARLSSGLAVNSGRDGGARLSISEGMRAEMGGLTEGVRNAEHALNLLGIAEGAMGEISSILIRMRELAVQSANSTLNDDNRESLDAEFNQLKEGIDRIARSASYNDDPLLSGFGNQIDKEVTTALSDSTETGVQWIKLSGAAEGIYTFVDSKGDDSLTLGNGTVTQTVDLGTRMTGGKVADQTTLAVTFDRLGIEVVLTGDDVKGMEGSYEDGDLDGRTIVVEEGTGGSFQLGSDAIPADRLEYDIGEMTVDGPILDLAQVSIGTRNGARMALARIDEAIRRTALERGAVGAIMNRLEYTADFTANAIERISASESTVRDTDIAWETSQLVRDQIVSQLSTAALIQSRFPINTVMALFQ